MRRKMIFPLSNRFTLFYRCLQDVRFVSSLSGKYHNNNGIAQILENKTSILKKSEYTGIKFTGHYV